MKRILILGVALVGVCLTSQPTTSSAAVHVGRSTIIKKYSIRQPKLKFDPIGPVSLNPQPLPPKALLRSVR